MASILDTLEDDFIDTDSTGLAITDNTVSNTEDIVDNNRSSYSDNKENNEEDDIQDNTGSHINQEHSDNDTHDDSRSYNQRKRAAETDEGDAADNDDSDDATKTSTSRRIRQYISSSQHQSSCSFPLMISSSSSA